MGYFGISLAVDDLGGDMYVNWVITVVVELPGYMIGIWMTTKLGRKNTSVSSCITGGVLITVIAVIPTPNLDWNPVKIFVGVVGKFWLNIAYSTIYVWSMELYPTKLRANGIAVVQIAARIGSAVAPFVAKGLSTVHYIAPFLVIGVLPVTAGLLFLFLRETANNDAQTANGRSNAGIEMDVIS